MLFAALGKNWRQKYKAYCFCAFMLLSSSLLAQKISLQFRNAPLANVFSEIERLTPYRFSYANEALVRTKPVTVNISDEDLESALNKIFNEQPVAYTIDQQFIYVRPKGPEKTTSQPVVDWKITGTIKNEKGEEVSGASVSVKNTSIGTTSDGAGNFTLRGVAENNELIISSIGYQQVEVFAKGNTHLSIQLTLAIGKLDETLVIAYGSTTRRLSTGSVSKVSAAEISSQPVSNVLMALAGRAPGLQVTQTSGVPGGNINVLLRGRNSIASGSDPLFIIDGIPFNSTSLTSGYGGGAGSLSSPLNTLNPLDIESIEVLKDADATAIYGSRGANGVILITTKRKYGTATAGQVNLYRGFGRATRLMELMNTQQYLQMRREAFKNDGTTPSVANARDLLLWDTTRYTDWQKELIGKTSQITDAHATVSGGSESTKFLIGTGYHRESTIFPGDFGEQKFSGQYSITHQSADKKFKISFGGSYMNIKNSLPQVDLSSSITLPPNAPALFDAKGSLNWENSTWTNPLSNLEKSYRTTTDNFISHMTLDWQISNHLSVNSSFGYTTMTLSETITTPLRSYNPAFLPFSFAYAGFGTNTVKTGIAEPQLHYKNRFGKGYLSVLLGASMQQKTQRSLLQTGVGFASDEQIENIRAAATISIDQNNITDYKYLGFFGRLNYDLDKKYLLSLTARRDGSSRFGPSNRFANFGAIGVAWIFSREKLLKRLPLLSFGKLKGSWGVTGNDQIGDYKYLNTYSSYTYPYQNLPTLLPTQLYNPGYEWEKVTKTEAGLDLGFLQNKILLSAGYYHNLTSNQLLLYPLPGVTGFTGVLQNLPAQIQNKGWEFEITTTNLQGKNVEWTTSFNLTIPRNKLLSYPGLAGSSYANTYVVGQSLFISKRLFLQGVNPQTGLYMFEDYDKDGRIATPADQQAIVFTGQQFYGGMQNQFRYKQWHLAVFFQFVKQTNATNYLSRFARPGTMSNQPQFLLERWQHSGEQAEYALFSNSNAAANTSFNNLRQSTGALSDASFARLKNVMLTYEFGKSFLRKLPWLSGKLYAQGQNVLTITGYKGLDPETKTVVPPLRTFTFGIQINLK